MNKKDKDKAVEISGHYLQIVDCFAKTHYDEDDILSTARDAAMEMAAWKEQQMIEKAVSWISKNYIKYNEIVYLEDNNNVPTHIFHLETFIEDFKKYMEEN